MSPASSSPLNPYASWLGDRDPLQVIASTPARLSALIHALGPDGAESAPAPGKWNAREITCHLADTEIAFAFRLRQTLAQDRHLVQPFDQERWAVNYAAYEARAAVEAFTALREWNVALIESLPPEAFSKPLIHPERGEMTFRTLLETMAGHDLNHLSQIEAIVARHGVR